MTATTLYQLLGEVDEGLISEARPKKQHRRHIRVVPLLAAVLALLLLGAAEATRGSVSNLLAPLYGGARTDIVDSIGRPLNASATADGYTITAEAVIGDRYHVSVVYTLTRDDGEPIPEHIQFDRWDEAAQFGAGSSMQGSERTEGLSANQIRLVEQVESSDFPILFLNHHAHVTFSGLRQWEEGKARDECKLLAEGPWELDFALRYGDATMNVPVHDLVVTDADGEEYTVKKIQLSPFSVHIDLIAPSPYAGYETPDDYMAAGSPGEDWTRSFEVSLRMKEGVDLPQIWGGGSASSTFGEPTMKAAYDASFDVPSLPGEAEAIVLCGTEVSVK